MERRRPRMPPARPLVLFVDGHEDTRELYAVALASFEFETITVDDAQRAFARAWEAHPDVIVTEISFPESDGWQLVHDLKRDPRTRDIPVVVLTGRVDASVRQRAEHEGCATLLLKPCLPEDLMHVLRELIDRGALHSQMRGGDRDAIV
jgi:chemosensory pili system protein ChpA (sensor histidine kinase/response regulator)